MNKHKTIILASLAIIVLSAVAAGNAFAEQWLEEGKPITTPQAGLVDGLLLVEHKGGLTGNSVAHCTGQFHGTFGPGTSDTITGVLGLKGETANVDCEVVSGACGAKELTLVTALHLPWNTKLILIAGEIWDETGEGSTKAGTPGYEGECDHLKIKFICEGIAGRAKFIHNGTNGAVLEFRAEETPGKCNDGGTALSKGVVEALGFTIS